MPGFVLGPGNTTLTRQMRSPLLQNLKSGKGDKKNNEQTQNIVSDSEIHYEEKTVMQ